MLLFPDYDSFTTTYQLKEAQVVATRLVADLETPVSVMLKLAHKARYAFLLESVEGGAVRGRYSIIGMNPDLIWKVEHGQALINTQALHDTEAFEPCDLPPLDALRQLLKQSRITLAADLPPMSAGVFGYMGYDMVRLMERLPQEKPDSLGVPDAIFTRPTIMVIFDSVRDEITIAAPVYHSEQLTAKAAYARAHDRITQVIDALDRLLDQKSIAPLANPPMTAAQSNTTPEEYSDMIAQAQAYITAGDIFQVVLSQRFETDYTLPPFALYRALRRVNPSPFLYYLNFDDFAVVGSSPEILVRVREDKVTIRPIAGTRRRGATPAEDHRLAAELLADPKECAEHLMLLDLGRNDVGRVAEVGSISVTDKFFIENYSEVMHIVSNVEGTLDKRYDVIDALVAGFPAGTVSGAPKVRAMEIIDELEKDKRGIYAGCVGYFSADGEMDTCIVLRTAIIKNGKMYVQAGAGIVADSQAASENQECINKARALFRAAEESVRFAGRSGRAQ